MSSDTNIIDIDETLIGIDELEDEGPQLYEHHRFVVDKGQVPIRVDKYMCEKLTHSSILEYRERSDASAEDRFTALNNLALARDMNDDATFLKLSEEYDRQVYLTDHLFLPGRIGRQG